MHRHELNELIKQGPVRIRMNNGDVWDVPSPEFGIVGDIHAHILHRDADNVLRGRILSLVAMCSAELLDSVEN